MIAKRGIKLNISWDKNKYVEILKVEYNRAPDRLLFLTRSAINTDLEIRPIYRDKVLASLTLVKIDRIESQTTVKK